MKMISVILRQDITYGDGVNPLSAMDLEEIGIQHIFQQFDYTKPYRVMKAYDTFSGAKKTADMLEQSEHDTLELIKPDSQKILTLSVYSIKSLEYSETK